MTASQVHDYDVVLMSDLRYPGGNSASLAEEIKAQARAGYRTGLVHVRARHMSDERTLNRRIANCLRAGLAELVPARSRVRTRLLVVRQPQLFTHELEVTPRVQADATVLVANQPPVDRLRRYYDVAAVDARARELLGELEWAPIGPAVRAELARSGAPIQVRERDWVNILDVGEWRADRRRRRGDVPVIGRHSRGHVAKWPADRREILAAYPDDDAIRVKILGGAEPAVAVLGRLPAAWTVYPFGSRSPQRFLAEIDVFVYYHHPDWIEAFGRNIIEAMASGCPVILPPHFEPTFGPAVQYAPPAGARGLVDALWRDPTAYRERSQAGLRHVEAHYGTRAHVDRVQALIGAPRRAVPAVFPSRPRAARRVLLVAAEPDGLGSVTRLLRAAARFPADVEPVLLAVAPAIPAARAAGMLAELLPAASLAGDGRAAGRRVLDAARRHGADTVLLDARSPGAGLVSRAANVPRLVWLRIAGTAEEDGLREHCAAVIELGDLLGPADPPDPLPALLAGDGPSAVAGAAPLALLAPGADERVTSVPRVGAVAEALLQAGWSVVFPEPVVATGETRLPDGVRRERLPSLAGALPAFDLVVAAPGHTMVHDLAAAGVPALLVPLRLGRGDERRIAAARTRGLADGAEGFDGLAGRLGELRERGARAVGAQLADAAPLLLDALGVTAG